LVVLTNHSCYEGNEVVAVCLVVQFDLMMKLHPTPAVCGHPQALAKFAISMSGMCLPHPINEHNLIFPMMLLLPNLLSQSKWLTLLLAFHEQKVLTEECMRVLWDGLGEMGRNLLLGFGHH
jgi:hypothetical protein